MADFKLLPLECKAKTPYTQDPGMTVCENWDCSPPSWADLPRRSQDRRGHCAADDCGDRDRDGERRGRGPTDRAEGFRECRQPRGGLAAAELAALGLDAKPE